MRALVEHQLERPESVIPHVAACDGDDETVPQSVCVPAEGPGVRGGVDSYGRRELLAIDSLVLARLLALLQPELFQHMLKEEEILFPWREIEN